MYWESDISVTPYIWFAKSCNPVPRTTFRPNEVDVQPIGLDVSASLCKGIGSWEIRGT